jgi:hypothetical protein
MSLFKNQNKNFEKKLKHQLNETGFKPSESLWSNIDQEVNRPKFEEKVKGKIGNYKLNPNKTTWEKIEAQFPLETKGKNNKKYFWISLSVILFIGFSGLGYLINRITNPLTEVKPKLVESELVIEANTIATSSVSNIELSVNKKVEVKGKFKKNTSVLEKFEQEYKSVKDSKTKYNKKSNNKQIITQNKPALLLHNYYSINANKTPKENNPTINHTIEIKNEASMVNRLEKSNYITTPVEQGINTNKIQPNLIDNKEQTNKQEISTYHQPNKTEEPSDTSITARNIIPAIHDSVTSQIKPSINDGTTLPSRLSLSVMIGAHFSQMQLNTNKSDLTEHVALRNQIESAKIDWSGAFLLDYEWNKLLISSGVQFTHFSMGMTYGTTQATQPPKYDANSQVATNDSVTANGINNTRIKYSWNEIPLLITYRFTPHKRFGIETKIGMSYAFISTIDAALVGQNNVGVLVVKNKESFPFIKNSIFAHLHLGLAYQINQAITLTAAPYLRYSLNSMTSNNYSVKQYPYMLGMSIGLRKHF